MLGLFIKNRALRSAVRMAVRSALAEEQFPFPLNEAVDVLGCN